MMISRTQAIFLALSLPSVMMTEGVRSSFLLDHNLPSSFGRNLKEVSTASFSGPASNGASWGEVQFIPGTSEITVSLNNPQLYEFLRTVKMDTDKFPYCWGDEEDSGSLQWHIHDFWNYDDGTTFATMEGCSAAKTGGHWDPTLACGSKSGNPLCKDQSFAQAAVAQRGPYNCTPASYQADPFACEVGDLSGKYGFAPISKTGSDGNKDGVERHEEPQMPQYFHLLGNNKSIVVHCRDGTRVICGKLQV